MNTFRLDIKEIGTLVERYHKQVVAIIMALTLLALIFLPSIKFETNLEEFFPENEVVDSNDRVKEYFGHDPVRQYVDVAATDAVIEPGNDSDTPYRTVFSIYCLREQYNLSKVILEHEGVVGVIGLAVSIQERLEEKGLSILEVDLGAIKEALMNSSESDSEAQEYLVYLKKLLLSKDADLQALEWEYTTAKVYGNFSPFSSRTLIIVEINSTIPTEERKELANSIREDVDAMDFTYLEANHVSSDLMAYDVDEASNQSMGYLGALILGSIIVILYLNFRDWSYVGLCLATLIIATIWTLATIVLLGMKFTALEVAVIPLIIGMGVDDSVHFSRRYLEERHSGKDVKDSISITFKSIGMAIFLTSLTTAIAFLSNATSDVQPVREFGFVCAFGIAYAFIVTVTFHLAARYWLDSRRVSAGVKDRAVDYFGDRKEKTIDLDALMRKVAQTIEKVPLSVVLVAVLLTIASLASSGLVEREFDVEDFLPESFDTVETGNIIYEEYEGGTFTTAYVLVEGDDVATVSTLRALNATSNNILDDMNSDGELGERFVLLKDRVKVPLMDNMLFVMDKAMETNDSLRERFHFVLSGDSDNWPRDHFVPGNQTTDEDVKAFFEYLLQNDTTMQDIYGLPFSNATKKLLYRDENGNYEATLIKVSVRSRTNEHARVIHRELKRNVEGFDNGEKATVTGYVILLVVTSDTLQESQINATIISVALAFVILLVVFKGDWKLSLIGIVPVVFSTSWILGFMVLSTYGNQHLLSTIPAISLNVLTVTVTSLSIGLGIDFAIHIIERFREDLSLEHTDAKDAIGSTLEHTGSALLISGITTIVGFGVLLFSPMPIVRSYGLVTSVIILFSLVASTFVLPVILVFWATTTGKFPGLHNVTMKEMIRKRVESVRESKTALIRYLHEDSGPSAKKGEKLRRREFFKEMMEQEGPEQEKPAKQTLEDLGSREEMPYSEPVKKGEMPYSEPVRKEHKPHSEPVSKDKDSSAEEEGFVISKE